MSGPASHLINMDIKKEASDKIHNIFQQAARLSYELWTRKTALECYTLQSFRHGMDFDAESSMISPYTLVRYDEHDDQL